MADEGTPSRRVRELAAADPGRTAFELAHARYTYGQLDQMADALGWELLRRLGPGEHRVGHCVTDAMAMVVADLALDRAGKIAVPLGPAEPPARLQDMLDRAGCPLVVTDIADLDIGPRQRVLPFGHPTRGSLLSAGLVLPELLSITFTSGSAGQPKGILRTRRWSTHFGEWAIACGLAERTRSGTLFAGPSAAISLGTGLTMTAGASGTFFDLRSRGLLDLAGWIEETQVTRMLLVPTVARTFLATDPDPRQLRRLRVVGFAGETTTWEDIAAIRPYLDPEAEIRNNFGLTETGLVTSLVIPPDAPLGSGPLPAGHPLPGVTLTIGDPDGHSLPAGTPGEIVVEGVHCATGCWTPTATDADRFTELPDGRQRVRTGDRGLVQEDGTLVHLGRLDHMVKISGHRIELGEIEASLRSVDGVEGAAAAIHTDVAGNTRLRAFVVPAGGRTLDGRAIRAALCRRLPPPMVPDTVEVLTDLPMLPGGKVDRTGLGSRSRPVAVSDSRPPGTERERTLAAIWAEVLALDAVGIDDDFFELGGDSLRAARMFDEMHRRLGIDRPVSMLFEAPTIAQLLAMADIEAATFDVVVPFRPTGSRPALFVVHGGGGDILFVRHLLPGLSDQQPVYGIQPPLTVFNGRVPPGSSIEELARRYTAELRRVQPSGPYLLFGYSFGGIVAFEMALQLQRADQTVGLLAIGDTVLAHPAGPDRAAKRLAMRMAEIRLAPTWRQGGRLLLGYARRSVRSRLNRRRSADDRGEIARALERGEPVPPLLRNRYLYQAFLRLAAGYRPAGVFTGSPTYIRSTDNRSGLDSLAAVVSGVIQVVDVDGGHQDILQPPLAHRMAEVLDVSVELALRGVSSAPRPSPDRGSERPRTSG